MSRKKQAPKFIMFSGMRAGKTAMADLLLNECSERDIKRIAGMFKVPEWMLSDIPKMK